MSTYYDTDGDKISLRQLVITDPDWAVSRITELEGVKQQLAEKDAEIARLLGAPRTWTITS